jgi:hypothetical protein
MDERLAIKVKKGKTITQVLEHFFTHVHPSSVRPSVRPSALYDRLLPSMNWGKWSKRNVLSSRPLF